MIDRSLSYRSCSTVLLCVVISTLFCSSFALSTLAFERSSSAPSLETYNVDATKVSVSGVSAGGFMAVQFHVSHSASIMGAGVVAGGPFYCAQDNVEIALNVCMSHPSGISVSELVDITYSTNVMTDTVDDPHNMKSSRVLLFSGTKDTIVDQGTVIKLHEYYGHFMDDSQIRTIFDVPAGHSMVTNDYGNTCATESSPYLNNCDLDLAYEILSHIYGDDIVRGTAAVPANIISFDQVHFFADLPSAVSMADTGYLYVPTACQSGSTTLCRLHIAFHGCEQDTSIIQLQYVQHAGYNKHAEANNIIILYPQARTTDLINPKGCFDWWGYTSTAYASKVGPQILGIRGMMDRIIGSSSTRKHKSMVSGSSSSLSSSPRLRGNAQ